MQDFREQTRVGIGYLEAATTLLQEVRNSHPTLGIFEAADLQWWWRSPRPTDVHPQLFWFDDLGSPQAAVIATDWGDRVWLNPIVTLDASPTWIAHVVERGLAHASESGLDAVHIVVDCVDVVMIEVLADHGFAFEEDEAVETWLDVDARPEISPLPEDYRLSSRLDCLALPHHMIKRGGRDVETRLCQTSLYRPDLDLVVLDGGDGTAANGLFWFDPVTATGLVEPMRTEPDHQRRGLARHVLTSGIDRLAKAGAPSASRSSSNRTTRQRGASTSASVSNRSSRRRCSSARANRPSFCKGLSTSKALGRPIEADVARGRRCPWPL